MGKKSKNKEGGLELEVKKIKLEEPETPDITEQPELSYEDKLQYVNVIAKPMATKSQAKKIYKLIKKASKEKGYLRAGLRDVQKRIRLGETGIVVFAGDVSPIEIMCHMPFVCEQKNIPYCYTPCHKDLGNSDKRKQSITK